MMMRYMLDDHDRGLAFDLSKLRDRTAGPRRIERRGALKLLAGAGAGLVLIGCGSDSNGSADTSTTSSTSTTAEPTSSSTSTTATSGTSTEAIPEETAGPFPGDGSNGPNVLTESGVVRQDITTSFGSLSGTAQGIPLTVDLTVVEASSGEPLDGAAMYLWHCDRDGDYSLYSEGVTDQNYLRGVQAAGSDGTLRFTSIFPGAYAGRWPHMHFEVFSSLDAAAAASDRLVTSQLALPQDVCDTVYATAGYEQSVTNLSQLSLASDGIFSDGYDTQLATVTGSVDSGLTATLTVPV